jgi:alkaline phosphatase D
MLRHSIFLFMLLLLIASCKRATDTSFDELTEEVAPLYDSALKPFYHGVASGDPLTDRVIIWTRVTPNDVLSHIPVEWEIAENENFNPIVKSDTTSASPSQDYTVKVDVAGLLPGKYYFYRFKALDKTSPVGRTKTIARSKLDSLKFAVVSCNNWEFGYFNAYNGIADKDLDAVLHLGDYIYEYGQGGYANKNVDRKHLPPHEIVSLQDYRTRYSQYHLDASLRKARAKHPFITVWDDHEVANDVYTGGAQNHQADEEGDFNTRKAAAKKAYYEWMPIRENEKHFRAFSFGDLASLIMLDERLEGRVKPSDSISDPSLFKEDRTMLGAEQLQWFEAELNTSGPAWKVIGNQVLFSDLDQSFKTEGHQRNLDSWDGYPAEKKRIADFIRENNIKDVIFLAGDTHSSWAFEVAIDPARTYNKKTSAGAFAVEFGTTSVSSGNANERLPDDTVKVNELRLLKANPHLKFTNHRDHGYLLLTLYPQKAKAEWYYVETLLQPDERERLAQKLEVDKGRYHLK